MVSAAEPPLTCTSLLQICTRGLKLTGEYNLVVWAVVCTKGTNQFLQSALVFTTDNSKSLLLTYCGRTTLLFLFLLLLLWAPTALNSRGWWGRFLRATPKLEPPTRAIVHVASSGWGTGQAGAGQCWSLHCVSGITSQHHWAEPLVGALQLLHCPVEVVTALQPLTTPTPLPLPVR